MQEYGLRRLSCGVFILTFYDCGKIAVKKIARYFDEGITFNQETTLYAKSILSNIAKAKKRRYFTELHYIGVENADIAKERVARRIKQDSHGIAEQDM